MHAEVFESKSRVLQNSQAEAFWNVAGVDRDHQSFACWVFENQVGTGLASLAVAWRRKKRTKARAETI